MALYFQKEKKPCLRIKSFVRDTWYEIDVQARICSCPAFKRGKVDRQGLCKHLAYLGLYVRTPYQHKIHPTFSQALSGLVKSLRVRDLKEAVYWLMYMHRTPEFQEPKSRFRVARRLLIGTAEDGHSIPVMERTAHNMSKLPKDDLIYWIGEAVRICKMPNWWHPDSGGPEYIYQSLVGWRRRKYQKWSHKVEELEQRIRAAIEAQDQAMAIGFVVDFDSLKEPVNSTKQAEILLKIAEERQHELAVRLCKVHLSAKTALSGDNNFLCQAAWMMAGGVSPIAEKIEDVTVGECWELMREAEERWKTPHPIPGWCCDGIHCGGGDPRFAGLLPQMWAVCRAFQHYGRVDPADQWLPEFLVWDGLETKVC